MAKVFKISAYVVDYTGKFGDNQKVADYLEYITQNDDIILSFPKIESADIGKWDDDHPLNYCSCPKSEYEKYFKERIVLKGVFSVKNSIPHDRFTDVSFIPVCDNCNYALSELSGKVGDTYVEPHVCPKCNKIIECVRLPIIDAEGKLNYEEN